MKAASGPARIVGHAQSKGAGPMVNIRSTNWAGYVAKGQTFAFIRGSWVVPRVTCSSSDAVASFWVGMDGYQSRTVEQVGSLGYCHHGRPTYYTWWEMYPTNNMQLVGKTVHPGDHITATVSFSGHTFTLRVVDATHRENSFTKYSTCSSCRRATVEWVAERPGRASGLFPLAKFGHLRFSQSRVGVGSSRGSISRWAHDAIVMINRNGATLANVSALQSQGNQFVATWLRSQ